MMLMESGDGKEPDSPLPLSLSQWLDWLLSHAPLLVPRRATSYAQYRPSGLSDAFEARL
jgi:hypothetical protein